MTRHHPTRFTLRRLHTAMATALPLLGLGLGLGLAAPAGAAVVISQVYGGGGNAGATYSHDFVELHNNGSTAVSLDGWSLQYASSAGSSWSNSTALSGSIAAGGYFLVRQASNNTAVGAALPATPDLPGGINLSGTSGKLALVSSTVALTGSCPVASVGVLDFIGYGAANCAETTAAPALTSSTALLRGTAGCSDSGNNSVDLISAAPLPRSSATAVQVCSDAPGPGPSPAPAPPPAAAVSAAVYSIQGSGAQSPLVGQTVATTGVVTKVHPNGFFLQDLVGDGNPATSDGLFVFTGTTLFPAAVAGHLVTVTGTVTEFNTGATASVETPTPTVTELTAVSSVTQQGSGYRITPTVLSLPEAAEGDLERHEGMLVTLTGPLTVQQNFFQARYGQLTLAVGGRLETPTNRWRPGPQAQALANENARRRILLDDGSSLQNPNPTPYLGANALPRAGDQVATLTGVIDFGLATSTSPGLGDYKIHPTVAPVFTPLNLRTATPPPVGGNVKVASFNVLNYFTTFTNGNTDSGLSGQGCLLGGASSASNCRGANNAAEFQRQRGKIVEALAALNADAVGLMEIQNNGNTAVLNLVNALNTRLGAAVYSSVALPPQGTGSDAIRVAMIYKPGRLATVGAPVSDTDAVNNRPTLAQTFGLANGERFTLLVNHLKSKGSCPSTGDANADRGDGQGCWNLLRTQQAQRLRSFVAQVQTAAGSHDALLIGDFNAYGQEDPIFALTGSGYVDQIGRFDPFGYSYVFDGAAGRLDHAIASGTLSARVARAALWHINADELAFADYNLEFKAPLTCGSTPCPADPFTLTPYRSSDHDPVVVGLSLYKAINGTAGRDVLVGTPGDDLVTGGAGADTLTGGAGSNVFVYSALRDAGDVITDFVPGKDLIDLRSLVASLPVNPANVLAAGVVRLVADGAHTLLQIDVDGSAGAAAPRTLATLLRLSPAALSPTRDLLLP